MPWDSGDYSWIDPFIGNFKFNFFQYSMHLGICILCISWDDSPTQSHLIESTWPYSKVSFHVLGKVMGKETPMSNTSFVVIACASSLGYWYVIGQNECIL